MHVQPRTTGSPSQVNSKSPGFESCFCGFNIKFQRLFLHPVYKSRSSCSSRMGLVNKIQIQIIRVKNNLDKILDFGRIDTPCWMWQTPSLGTYPMLGVEDPGHPWEHTHVECGIVKSYCSSITCIVSVPGLTGFPAHVLRGVCCAPHGARLLRPHVCLPAQSYCRRSVPMLGAADSIPGNTPMLGAADSILGTHPCWVWQTHPWEHTHAE